MARSLGQAFDRGPAPHAARATTSGESRRPSGRHPDTPSAETRLRPSRRWHRPSAETPSRPARRWHRPSAETPSRPSRRWHRPSAETPSRPSRRWHRPSAETPSRPARRWHRPSVETPPRPARRWHRPSARPAPGRRVPSRARERSRSRPGHSALPSRAACPRPRHSPTPTTPPSTTSSRSSRLLLVFQVFLPSPSLTLETSVPRHRHRPRTHFGKIPTAGPGTGSQAQGGQAGTMAGPGSQGPAVPPVGLADRQIIDAREPPPHEAALAELPVLVSVGAEPLAAVVAPLVGEPDRDPVLAKRPQLLDEPVLELARPRPGEEQ